MKRFAEWRWHTFEAPGLPVSFPALSIRHFRWRGIYGAQIGPWFIGAVRGEPGAPYDAATDTTLASRPAAVDLHAAEGGRR